MHSLIKIAVSGRKHSNINPTRRGRSYALYFSICEYSQEFRLSSR